MIEYEITRTRIIEDYRTSFMCEIIPRERKSFLLFWLKFLYMLPDKRFLRLSNRVQNFDEKPSLHEEKRLPRDIKFLNLLKVVPRILDNLLIYCCFSSVFVFQLIHPSISKDRLRLPQSFWSFTELDNFLNYWHTFSQKIKRMRKKRVACEFQKTRWQKLNQKLCDTSMILSFLPFYFHRNEKLSFFIKLHRTLNCRINWWFKQRFCEKCL